MKAMNHACAYKAGHFKLPTLEGPEDLLPVVVVVGGGGGHQG